MFAYCQNSPVMYSDPKGTELVLDKRIMFGIAGGGGGVDVTSIFILVVDALIGTVTKPDTEEQENSIAIADTQTKKSDDDAIFTPNPYDFNPNGLIMHVCVAPGTGPNGGVIKWEVPGTKIAVFEWDEDWQYGAHYHTLKVEWKNEHIGVHHPIGSKVPEPWQSMYF